MVISLDLTGNGVMVKSVRPKLALTWLSYWLVAASAAIAQVFPKEAR